MKGRQRSIAERNAELKRRFNVEPPRTTAVYCPEGMHHWQAPARDDYWNARVETCEEHKDRRKIVPNSDWGVNKGTY